jgi:microsomal dipeptidase-like Zn-dependent dipeptidase
MVKGFADIHNHQFAYLGFGGLAFHGKAFGDMKEALNWCDFLPGVLPPLAVHGPAGAADFVGNLMMSMYSHPPLFSVLGHHVGGYPDFDGWPRWDSVTHQSVYEDWLYRAVQGGLRLLVMLAVNNEKMCGGVNHILSCNDMEAVDRQLAEARAMQDHVDAKAGGPGNGWYRIVSNPAEARRVMEGGRLAVVLGIEVDYLFNCHREGDISADSVRDRLKRYYDVGVRHIFPIHFDNNGYGGTAFQNDTEYGHDPTNPVGDAFSSALNPLSPGIFQASYRVTVEDGRPYGYEYRTGKRNVQGLTSLGKTLIREMTRLGMIIDVDHMSARSKADTFDICEETGYPVVAGHAGFVEISHREKAHEGQLLPSEIERIRGLGGMLGVIPHQGRLGDIDSWVGPGQTRVPHTCGNSSNTLLQAYLYAASKMQGGAVAFGTDFNGFAGLPGPRFGNDKCNGGSIGAPPSNPMAYPFIAAASGVQMPADVSGNKTFDFNFDGLAHIGMLPDLIADFEAQGLTASDLSPLLNSAEGYIRVWERAWMRGVARDGALLRESSSPSVYIVFGQAKFHVPDPPTLSRLYDVSQLEIVWDGALDLIPGVPTDGHLLRDENGTIYVIYGGAKFGVPDPPTLTRLFPGRGWGQLWNGALDGLPTTPVDGTLLRDENGAIYVIYGGAKFHVPDPPTLTRLFPGRGWGQLWNGALDGLPTTPVDGTLLREEHGPVFVMRGGHKTAPESPFLMKFVRVLWDGALAAVP